ncbi:MAG: SoxR reducing system RseC family protein [Bacteroidales bacterium]|nr:SoxR reducing system RseC family protein [Bacteroidales bacterium]
MESVSHSGVIRSVGPEKTVVEILSQSACASCHAQGLCTAADAVTKAVEVPSAPGFQVGETVTVQLRESMGFQAVLLCYVIPVLLLLGIVVGLSYTSLHELWVGLAGVAAVGLWYGVLWLLRGHIARDYVFTMEKIKR